MSYPSSRKNLYEAIQIGNAAQNGNSKRRYTSFGRHDILTVAANTQKR